jgi:PEP-CTERM motif
MRILGTVAIALAASFVVATPASAVITTFANFSADTNGANVYFLNAASNSDAAFFTTATSSSTTASARQVSFNFLPSEFNAIGPVNALWSLNGIVTNTVATIGGANIFQRNIAGSFSFINTSAIAFGNTAYAAGSNLLSGTFTNSTIVGLRNGTSAGFSGSPPVSSISYTSDFLTFAPGSDYDLSISLIQIFPALNALPTNGTPTSALRTFRAVASGQFSSDPGPLTAVPEPETWAMMIVGFGLIGGALRRRSATGGPATA